MADADDKTPAPDARQTREARLAKALRDNLRRRKAVGASENSDPDHKPPR